MALESTKDDSHSRVNLSGIDFEFRIEWYSTSLFGASHVIRKVKFVFVLHYSGAATECELHTSVQEPFHEELLRVSRATGEA